MLLVDTTNLFHCAFVRHGGRVDYDLLMKHLRSRYDWIKDCARYAYVARTDGSDTFTKYLRSRGFLVRVKTLREDKFDTFDVDLAIDAVRDIQDRYVICSASRNLLPLIQTLMEEGSTINIHAYGVPHIFREYCNVYELPNILKAAG